MPQIAILRFEVGMFYFGTDILIGPIHRNTANA